MMNYGRTMAHKVEESGPKDQVFEHVDIGNGAGIRL